jgi:hypothetical protein
MPTLTVDIAFDPPGDTVTDDPEGIVTVQSVTNGQPDPWPTTFTLAAGVGSIVLAEGYYWVHRFGGSKLVHLTADARLDELEALNPETVVPGVEPPPASAWREALELRPILVRLTQAEYDALTPAEQADPLRLYVIPAT